MGAFMGKAFRYMFAEKNFLKGCILYIVLSFVSNFLAMWANMIYESTVAVDKLSASLILCFFSFAITLVINGFGISCVKALINDEILPVFKFRQDFVRGFKIAIAFVLLFLACALLLFFFALITLPLFTHFMTESMLKSFYQIVIVLTSCVILFYLPVFIFIFAKKGWITSLFRFLRATYYIRRNVGRYLKYLGILILLSGSLSFLSSALTAWVKNTFGILLSSVVLAIVGAYIFYVTCYIIAKSIDVEAE